MERVDNRISVETPEAVEFQLDLAGLVPRGGAWLIDGVIKLSFVTVVALVAALVPVLGVPVTMLVSFGAMWLYNPLFEVFNNGQTPGKQICELRVVHTDGTPVGWYGSIVRNLVRVVDALPIGYTTGVVSMMVSGKFQRLGDVAGDTVVVYRRNPFRRRDANRLPDAEPVEIPVVLTPQEQEAIVSFAERSRTLGEDRSGELAGILRPVVDAATRREALHRLHGLARRIVRWG